MGFFSDILDWFAEDEDARVLRIIRSRAKEPGYWEKPAKWMYKVYAPHEIEEAQERRWLEYQAFDSKEAMRDWDIKFSTWQSKNDINEVFKPQQLTLF